MVNVNGDVPIIFNGSTEPTAFCEIFSIGNLGVEENKKLSKSICESLESHFKISPSRVYINFRDVDASGL